MIDLIFLLIAIILPIMVICKVFENSCYDERTISKKIAYRKKHDYYINKFLNYTPVEIKND